ncbi:hypothetical protein [Aquibacillus salsiterrae]|uniref:Uncharacterized protein n=1 Tax=Aquibacillus salsiterrae TaxID=2950439 RepID=A0A9X3WH11_9BACI|nr:hypothetical protein [Aquibacillus salsiterrae]MDC3418266.1 hypothetical protein [Aquibacillus salsiterrae]
MNKLFLFDKSLQKKLCKLFNGKQLASNPLGPKIFIKVRISENNVFKGVTLMGILDKAGGIH